VAPPDVPRPPEPGRLLGGRYRLVRPIARGGMADVWEGHDEVLSRPVAVKLLQAHLAEDGVFLERFRREAVTAARLAHPGVVSTFDTGVDIGTAYIVMELVRGFTLRQLLNENGPHQPALAVAIARQIADVLSYAHQAGLVHRDIKPANMLLTDDESGGLRVKVTDFGIAKAGSGVGGDLTRTGIVLGTPKYLSPEQIRGDEPEARADLYSLGVVLFEMLTGAPPFLGNTDMAIALAHLNDPTPLVSSRVPDVPPALDRLVADLLTKDPQQRVPSASILRQRLDGLILSPPSTGPAGARRAGFRHRDATAATGGTSRPTTGRAGPASYAGPLAPGRTVTGGHAGPPTPGSGSASGPNGPGRPGAAAAAHSSPQGDGPGSPDYTGPPPPGRTDGAMANLGADSPRSPAPVTKVLAATGGPSAPIRADQPERAYRPQGASAPARTDPVPVSGPPRPPRRRRGPGLVVLGLVVAGAIVAGVLLVERDRRPSGRGSAETTLTRQITSVSPFMLRGNPDDPRDLPLLFDHNLATAWHTDQYRTADFGKLYPGLGLSIQLSGAATLHRLVVTSPTAGWAAQTYVSATPIPGGQPVSAWGQATDTKTDISGSATFDLAGRRGQFVLLWLTRLSASGPPFQVTIDEISVS
jgi:eukaryotic-like serine/threonine-protein kinase